MSAGRKDNTQENVCSHSNTVDDDVTCEAICTDCGLVLEKIYCNQYEPILFEPSTKNSKIQDFIYDVCAHAEIPKRIADITLNAFNKKIEEDMTTKKLSHLAAFLLYNTLNKEGCPRTPQEISYFTNVPQKVFFQQQSIYPNSNKQQNEPESFMERDCSLLNFTYAESKKIFEVASIIDKNIGNIKGSCLSAVAIVVYSKILKKKRLPTITHIAKICNVSTATIHRTMKILKKSDCIKKCLVI